MDLIPHVAICFDLGFHLFHGVDHSAMIPPPEGIPDFHQGAARQSPTQIHGDLPRHCNARWPTAARHVRESHVELLGHEALDGIDGHLPAVFLTKQVPQQMLNFFHSDPLAGKGCECPDTHQATLKAPDVGPQSLRQQPDDPVVHLDAPFRHFVLKNREAGFEAWWLELDGQSAFKAGYQSGLQFFDL
jgi:hypothetical protein